MLKNEFCTDWVLKMKLNIMTSQNVKLSRKKHARGIVRLWGSDIRYFFICSIFLLSFAGMTSGGASPSAQGEKGQCSPLHMQKCMNLLQAINRDHNMAFPSTEQELEDMCRTMNKGLQCVSAYIEQCFNRKRQNLINNLLHGTTEVTNMLCTPGQFRERYKIYAPCMKNVSTDPRICGPQYLMLIHSVSPRDDVSSTDTVRKQCCAFHTYLLCVTQAAVNECGADAASFIKEYSYQTAGPLIKNQCKNYKAGSLMCSLNKSKKLDYSTSLSCVLFFLYFLFLQSFFV